MIRRHLPVLITLAVFVAGYLICLAQFPSFASTRVIGNLLTDNAFLGIVAVGMTFAILSGGIDLSVGSVIAFTGVFLAVAIERYDVDPYLAFVLILAIGALFGAGMGFLIHTFQIPAFIVTLAGMFLARGMCFVLTTDSIPINAPAYGQITDIAVRLPGGGRLTFIAMVMLTVVGVGIVLAHFTRFGANVYALGGNRTSAELTGVPVGKTTVRIYMLSSFLAAVAGIVFSFYTSAGYSLAATGVELDTIAAVVIGGTLLTGGYGTITGTLIGVLIQGLIQTYITFDGSLSSWWTKIAIGALLFAFIVLQRGLSAASLRSHWSGKSSVMNRMRDVQRLPRRRSAHDLVAHGIGQSIMQGHFPAGTTLPGDAELMEFFGVSRTALREALKTLAAKGLIESKTKVGTKVLGRNNWNMFDADIIEWHLELGVDAKFLGWLFEIRQTLEPLACATAALRRTPEQLGQMGQALLGMERCEKNRQGFTTADLAFHQAILEASGNPFLQSIGSVIGAALATSFTISSPVSSDELFRRVMAQHRAVFDAIEHGNASAASDAMSVLILQAAERVRIKRAESTLATLQVHAFSEA